MSTPQNPGNFSSNSEMENNPNSETDSTSGSGTAKPPSPSAICLISFAGDSAGGAVMGSIFGFGAGLISRKGFKGSLREAGSSAKAWDIHNYTYTHILIYLSSLAINAGVAGCCTGLALSFPGAPQNLLQSCLMYGAFSFIVEGLNNQQAALASPFAMSVNKQHYDVLPPLSLPLPNELKESFSSFCRSIRK
ncbi:mitochondrial import inner membrane translocase [Striga asiatica]|uniref:Mitochondrial import inner membrane translocase n=1 Tax=Striga asiatica TaxID=4170 RepID=A0A5A7QR65_STRAF|nr:mitochondrial import inner membrane translocase [Striga asiatica]